jgi:hypothetical protein
MRTPVIAIEPFLTTKAVTVAVLDGGGDTYPPRMGFGSLEPAIAYAVELAGSERPEDRRLHWAGHSGQIEGGCSGHPISWASASIRG